MNITYPLPKIHSIGTLRNNSNISGVASLFDGYYITSSGCITNEYYGMIIPTSITNVRCLCGKIAEITNSDAGKEYFIECQECYTVYLVRESHG